MMQEQLSEEQDLLECELILATAEDVLSAAGLTVVDDDGQVLEVLHEGEDQHGNIILSARNFTPLTISSQPVSQNDIDDDFLDDINNIITDQVEEKVEPLSPPEAESDSDTSGYKCKTCGKVFSSKKILKLHSTVHVDESLYACEFCPASKIHWTELWLHSCCNVESAPIVCPQCKKIVSTKKQLQVHEEVHDLQRRFTSRRMDGYFQRKLQEPEEPGVDWGAKPFICGVCGKQFGKLYEVEYHEKLHIGDRSTGNQCDKCLLTYSNKHDLNKHNALGCSGEISRKTNVPFKRKSNVTATVSSNLLM